MPAFNLPCRPDLNCAIEKLFSVIKQDFRKKRLRAIAKGKERATKMIVRDCLKSIERETIVNFSNKCLQIWRSSPSYGPKAKLKR